MNDKVDAAIARQWRQLGFWYDYTPMDGWILRGTKDGLLRLAEELEHYAADPRNKSLSEHEHLGPHMYLKLVTWDEAEINPDGIYGSLDDMKRLSAIVRKCIGASSEGSAVLLSTAYSQTNKAEMMMHVEKSGFDPAAYEAQLMAARTLSGRGHR